MAIIVDFDMPKKCSWTEFGDGQEIRYYCPIKESCSHYFKYSLAIPEDCPIRGEIPYRHGPLVDVNIAYDHIAEQTDNHYIDMDGVGKGLECTPVIVEANE